MKGLVSVIILFIGIFLLAILSLIIALQFNDAVSNDDVLKGTTSNVETNPYFIYFIIIVMPGIFLILWFKNDIERWIDSKIKKG